MRKGSAQTSPDYLPDHIFVLLEGVRRRMARELSAASPTPQTRASFAKLVQMVPDAGIRITDFARVSGMTKQALGEFVDAMEADGLVSSERLPTDRRVRLVRRTQKGDKISRMATDRIAEIEKAWCAEVGERRYATMKRVLRELGANSFDLPE